MFEEPTNPFLGFDRSKHYAVALQKILNRGSGLSSDFELPTNFNNHVNRILGALWAHLYPFFHLSDRMNVVLGQSKVPEEVFEPLQKIVIQAGILSLQMRIDPHTVYYFEPVFKEDNFDSKRMECFNFRQMQQQHPRHTPAELENLELDPEEVERRAKLSEAERKRARNDDPLTQITIMDAICAYRLGGWETANSTIAAPEYEKPEYPNQGVRTRLLTQAWVYCRWGRARRFQAGKPDDGGEHVHGDAWKGGFKEFTDVKGVYPWLDVERKEKAFAARAALEKQTAASKGKGKAKAA